MKFKYSILFPLILISFSLIARNNKNENHFELIGFTTKKIKEKKVYLSYDIEGVKKVDSAEILNEKFTFYGKILLPSRAVISNSRKFELDGINSAIIYLSPSKMVMHTDVNDFRTFKLSGSKTHDEYLKSEMYKLEISKKKDSITNRLNIYTELLKKNNEASRIDSALYKEIESLKKLREELEKLELSKEFEFVKQNPSSFVCLDILSFLIYRKEEVNIYDSISNLFDVLNPEIKNSFKGKQLNLAIANQINSKIGKSAPDFVALDIHNKTISISSFRHQKYLLLDFWASWCGPCRMDNPTLIELYKKYKQFDFEIIGLSKDSDKSSWKKAIFDDNIQIWTHVLIQQKLSTSNEIQNLSIAEEYFVSGIPVKILINKEGYIIGRWKGGGEENIESLKKKLAEIFLGFSN